MPDRPPRYSHRGALPRPERKPWATTTGSAASRGYGQRWKRLRDYIIAKEPYCRHCRARKVFTMATTVDHIVPKVSGGTDDEANLQPLCESCHKHKTAIDAQAGRSTTGPISDERWEQIRPTWIVKPPLMPAQVICGPPGSGKTTYAATHKLDGDLILDLDEIQAQQSGLPFYHADGWLGPALQERNRMIVACSERRICERLVLIIGAPTDSERQWWRFKLAASDVVLLATPIDVCVARMRSDPRRPDIDRFVKACAQWWRRSTPSPAGVRLL